MQIGELQCYDRRALASLAQAAQDRGHPEWGYTGPHDAGTYTSTPEVICAHVAVAQIPAQPLLSELLRAFFKASCDDCTVRPKI